MAASGNFWAVRIAGQSEDVCTLEQAFDDAIAISFLEAQPDSQAHIEILFDFPVTTDWVSERLLNIAPSPRFEIVPITQQDWTIISRDAFKPQPIARWTIFPDAYKEQIGPDTLPLQVEATSAFGTGEHPTTRGCLIMLDRLLKKHHRTHAWRMLDMGCGSGILAMAFASATSGHALGIDMDEQSVEIARENLKNNNLTKLVRIEKGTGYTNPLIAQSAPYDLIMANVFARPLCEMAKDLAGSLRQGGFAILSGILNKQERQVISAHRQQGLCLLHRMRIGEWSVLALRRPFRQS